MAISSPSDFPPAIHQYSEVFLHQGRSFRRFRPGILAEEIDQIYSRTVVTSTERRLLPVIRSPGAAATPRDFNQSLGKVIAIRGQSQPVAPPHVGLSSRLLCTPL